MSLRRERMDDRVESVHGAASSLLYDPAEGLDIQSIDVAQRRRMELVACTSRTSVYCFLRACLEMNTERDLDYRHAETERKKERKIGKYTDKEQT